MLMDQHVTDAEVIGHKDLIPSLKLPNPKDSRVLAAVIRSNSDAIVIFNLAVGKSSSLTLTCSGKHKKPVISIFMHPIRLLQPHRPLLQQLPQYLV